MLEFNICPHQVVHTGSQVFLMHLRLCRSSVQFFGLHAVETHVTFPKDFVLPIDEQKVIQVTMFWKRSSMRRTLADF